MNRSVSIIRVSRFAANLLHGVQSGTVHSVYHRTINLQLQPADSDACADDGADAPRLIALQDRDCVLSPLSLCTSLSADRLSSLPIQEGQSVLADRDGILIVTSEGMIEFEITDSAAATDLNLASHPALPLPADRLSALLININRTLPLSPSGSFARILCDPVPDNDLILAAAGNCISKAAALLQADEVSSAANTLCRGLIGLGSGLTPAGDDFLCGLLAGLCLRGIFAVSGSRLSAFARSLRAVVPDHLSDTIDISAAFLRCACEGQFSEAVIRLADDAAAGTENCRALAGSFSKIGHSSGFDTLAGISFALAIP